MALKKGDFVELDFTGKISSNDQVFDSTKDRGSVPVCIGAGMIFKKIDSALEGKNIGDEFDLELKPEEAFGARRSDLVQLTSINNFRKQNLNPMPGMQVNIDGTVATIRSVSGGRVTIDFNHPLAGKNLKFKIKIGKQITNATEKIKALLADWKGSVKEIEKGYEISLNIKLPEKIAELKVKQIKELIPEIKDKEVKFTELKVKPKAKAAQERREAQN